MRGHSSSGWGHLKSIHYDRSKPMDFVYFACIRECKETRNCVGITFRETTRDCWLKSTADHVPTKNRSFVSLDCLNKPQHFLYPDYNDDFRCVKGYENWFPESAYCYKLVTTPSTSYGAAMYGCYLACVLSQVMYIDSKKLNQRMVQEVAKLDPKHSTFWTDWKQGKDWKWDWPFLGIALALCIQF